LSSFLHQFPMFSSSSNFGEIARKGHYATATNPISEREHLHYHFKENDLRDFQFKCNIPLS
jgi:hypothetical protein